MSHIHRIHPRLIPSARDGPGRRRSLFSRRSHRCRLPAHADDYDATIKDIQSTMGGVPSFVKQFPKVRPARRMVRGQGLELSDKTALPPKTKALISLAVAAQIPCSYCIWVGHAERQARGRHRRGNPGSRRHGGADPPLEHGLQRHAGRFRNVQEGDGRRNERCQVADAKTRLVRAAPLGLALPAPVRASAASRSPRGRRPSSSSSASRAPSSWAASWPSNMKTSALVAARSGGSAPSTRKRTARRCGLSWPGRQQHRLLSACGSRSVPCARNESSRKVHRCVSSASRRSSLPVCTTARQPRSSCARAGPAARPPASIRSGGRTGLRSLRAVSRQLS